MSVDAAKRTGPHLKTSQRRNLKKKIERKKWYSANS